MTEHKEVENLLKNLQLGLQRYSISELNEAIVSVLKNKRSQRPDINYVLQIVADRYKISTKTLTNSKARGRIQDARMLAYCLLHYTIGCSTRFIASKFNRTNNAVGRVLKMYKALEPAKFKDHADFIQDYEQCQEKILKFLNNEGI